MLKTGAADNGVIVVYLNMVGGQDELVFDGDSMVFNEQGALIARAREFAEEMLIVDLDTASVFRSRLHDPRRRQERLQEDSNVVPVIKISDERSQESSCNRSWRRRGSCRRERNTEAVSRS